MICGYPVPAPPCHRRSVGILWPGEPEPISRGARAAAVSSRAQVGRQDDFPLKDLAGRALGQRVDDPYFARRSEEHTSELQLRPHLVCRLLLEKKKQHSCSSDIAKNNSRFWMYEGFTTVN